MVKGNPVPFLSIIGIPVKSSSFSHRCPKEDQCIGVRDSCWKKSSLLLMVMNIHSPLGNHKGMSFLIVAGATLEWLCHNTNAPFTQNPHNWVFFNYYYYFFNFRNKTEALVKYSIGFMGLWYICLFFSSFCPLLLPPPLPGQPLPGGFPTNEPGHAPEVPL